MLHGTLHGFGQQGLGQHGFGQQGFGHGLGHGSQQESPQQLVNTNAVATNAKNFVMINTPLSCFFVYKTLRLFQANLT